MGRLTAVRRATLLAVLAAAPPATAQAVRGTVLGATSGTPVVGATITLLGRGNVPAAPAVRTDSLGAFTVFALDPGSYAVRVTAPSLRTATSGSMKLAAAQIARVLISLDSTTAPPHLGLTAQTVSLVEEPRTLSIGELDAATGFDLRRLRAAQTGAGHLFAPRDLDAFSGLATGLAAGIGAGDARIAGGDSGLMLRRGTRWCAPLLIVDGKIVDGWPRFAAQEPAGLAGIEAYRWDQIPVMLFGTPPVERGSQYAAAGCGTLVAWSNAALGLTPSIAAAPVSARQLIRGAVLEFDVTPDQPIELAQVSLLTPGGEQIGVPVYTNRDGRFSLPVPHEGMYYLKVLRIGYAPTITPPMHVDANTTTDTEVRIARTAQALAPLAIAGTTVSRSDDVLDPMFGFQWRKDNLFGRFITRQQLADRNLSRFSATLSGIPNIILLGGSAVFMRGDPRCDIPTNAPDEATRRMILENAGCDPDLAGTGRCRPTLTLDGVPQHGDDTMAEIDGLLPDKIEGIEVYDSYLRVPGELLSGANRYRCGAIAVWQAK